MIACPPPELVALIDDATNNPTLWPVVCDWLSDHRMDDLAKELAEVVRLGRLPGKITLMPEAGWLFVTPAGGVSRSVGYGWVMLDGGDRWIKPLQSFLPRSGLTYAVLAAGSSAYLYPTMAEAVLAIAQAQHDYDNPPW